MYKYLLFDLDDTILDFKRAEATAIRQVFESFGIDSSDQTVEIYSAINEEYWKRFEKGEIEREDIFEGRFITFAKKLNLSANTAAISDAYFKALSYCPNVFKESEPLLKYLQNKYTLCAITNGNLITQKRRISLSGLEKFFGGRIYISEEIGYKKPEKEYFEFVFKSIGNPNKKEILILGDSLSGDILGAELVGVDSCFVNLRGQTDLKDRKPTYTVTNLLDIPKICGL